MRFTPRFGLLAVEPGDDPYAYGHKFFAADRDTIDTALWLANSGHVHDGSSTEAAAAPDDAPVLTLETTGGTISAGVRIWYTYTLVHQLTGVESGPAPVAFIDTPDPIDSPDGPGIAWGGTGGTLLPGQYFYILSAYTDTNTNETKAETAIGIVVSGSTSTNRIILTLPSLPFGADGFNIYRRTPGGTKYLYLDSVDMTVATPPTDYTDTGLVDEDCDRTAPYQNTTNATNAIEISIAGATPAVPVGYYWKIYRTVNESDWSASLLHLVVEETFEGSGIITPVYLDQGEQTTTGEPPASGIGFTNPQKIQLTDGAHVQGTLPMGMTAFPFAITLTYPGTLYVVDGALVWRCPFPSAEILWCAASLGIGSAPAATDVIVDVQHYNSTSETWQSLWTSDANRPRVVVGEQFGVEAYPATSRNLIERHDVLSMDILQIGGGATPNDENLTLTIYMIVQVPIMTSYVYNSTSGANAALGF